MKNFVYLFFFPLFLAGQLVSMSMARSAQAITYDRELQHQLVAGKVVFLEGNVIKVQNDDQITQLVLPHIFSLTKDFGVTGKAALQIGDQVKMQLDQLGQVQQVSAFSEELMNVVRWSLPVGLSGVGMIFLGLKLWHKYQDWRTMHMPIHVANI